MDAPKLNNEQKEAIEYVDGPLLIVAGAGTGKTTVITEKIKYLVFEKKINPEKILALTFTEKASAEMQERVDLAMPLGYSQMWISTFHSFCDRLLRESGIHIGIDPDYKILSRQESVSIIKKNLTNLDLEYFMPVGSPYKFINILLSHFSRLSDENITPNDYGEWLVKKKIELGDLKLLSEIDLNDIKKCEEILKVFEFYQNYKEQNSVFDFGDLINKTIELFKKRPNILKNYQDKFSYILVDEFQDTNYSQNLLSIMIAGDDKKICVVGDDNQSIYRFRGASVSNIMQFMDVFPDSKQVTLNKNYRSGQEILDASYKLVKNNDPDTLESKLGISKKLIATTNKKSSISLIQTQTSFEEAEQVVEQIKILNEKGYAYGDIAILVRANNHSDLFISNLEKQGIPYQFLGPEKLFDRPEIIDIMCFLKFLADPWDFANLFKLLAIDELGISQSDLIYLSKQARKDNIFLWDKVLQIDDSYNLKNIEKLKKISLILVDLIEKSKNQSIGNVLYEWLRDTDILLRISKINSDQAEIKLKNIAKFFEMVKRYELQNIKYNIFDFVEFLNLYLESGDSPSALSDFDRNGESVNILTVHSSKGLEFKVVFMVNLVSQRFPSMNRPDPILIPDELLREISPSGDFHMQEERRLFYVGMTRAKEKLFFTAAKYYGDGIREKKISNFVGEAIGEFESIPSEKVSKFTDNVDKKYLKKLSKKIKYLSYSQIETFKICPLHYKLRYIYSIPTPASPSSSFGVSFHAALADFYNKLKDGVDPSIELLYQLLDDNWISDGYVDLNHEKIAKRRGYKFLKLFLNDFYKKDITPEFLEMPFSFKVDDIRVNGKIDRINKINDGTIEIIDYKTGTHNLNQKEADHDLQLSIYCIAASEIFGIKPENIKLFLYYFDSPQIVETSRTQADLDNARKEILSWREQIEKSDFECNNSYFCQQGCEYEIFCGIKED